MSTCFRECCLPIGGLLLLRGHDLHLWLDQLDVGMRHQIVMLHVSHASKHLRTERTKYITIPLVVGIDRCLLCDVLRRQWTVPGRDRLPWQLVAEEMVLQLGTEEELLLALTARVRTHSDAVLENVELYRTRLTEGGAAH